MMRILAFHVFNDYSGSPKVLRSNLEGLARSGYQIDLFTSRGGVLDGLSQSGVKIHHFNYHFSTFLPLTALRSLKVQIIMLYYGLKYGHKDSVFFINTIMPLGGAIAGKILGAKVVYHYHENAFIKSAYYRFKAKWMERLADEIICVSEFQKSYLNRQTNVCVIPNAIPASFKEKLRPNSEEAFKRRNVLLLGSLKGYKGVSEFFTLANNLKNLSFMLVINDEQVAIDNYITNNNIQVPSNMTIYPRQKDVTPFYNQASIVLNLSNKKKILETFGLTAIESFAAGLPVIVPTEGGIAELVKDGYNGYKIDVQNLDVIEKRLVEIFQNKDLYLSLSENAIKESCKYDEQFVLIQIKNIL
jgi:glycosyltransferase involved in cell wall biosynthesis